VCAWYGLPPLITISSGRLWAACGGGGKGGGGGGGGGRQVAGRQSGGGCRQVQRRHVSSSLDFSPIIPLLQEAGRAVVAGQVRRAAACSVISFLFISFIDIISLRGFITTSWGNISLSFSHKYRVQAGRRQWKV